MKICVPIKGKSLQKMKKQVKKAQIGLKNFKNSFFEIWLDRLNGLDLEMNLKDLFRFCGKPVIAVCRGKIERGNFKGSEKDRVEILKNAVLAGAKLADIGIQTDKNLIFDLRRVCKKNRAKLIISKHIWDKTPELPELFGIFEKAKALGADIIKIAAYAKNWSDNTVLFELVSHVSAKGGKIIAVGMGERGKISRIGCPFLGAYLTCVALDEKSRTAKGQLTLREIKVLNI